MWSVSFHILTGLLKFAKKYGSFSPKIGVREIVFQTLLQLFKKKTQEAMELEGGEGFFAAYL